MKAGSIVQHISSALTFLTGLIFGLLKVFGVNITVNEEDVNTLIFGLASFIALLIQLIPFIVKMIKEKNLTAIKDIVSDVVKAVEELKDLTGEEKKAKAVEIILKECKERNLKITEAELCPLIEAVVALRNQVIKAG